MNWQPTVAFRRGVLSFLDQTALPARSRTLRFREPEGLIEAIQALRIRGAPAIGIAGAWGVVLAAWTLRFPRLDAKAAASLRKTALRIRAARPTAVNLMWAVDRMLRTLRTVRGAAREEVLGALADEARSIQDEDLRIGTELGRRAQTLVRDGGRYLTHCNAGGLATAGLGSALGVFWTARDAGKNIHVWVDETRPLLQGARLTAWELGRWGVPHTLLCDNMAALVMAQGKVDAVFVGADRIAANGDAANKIGTYGLAVLARFHRIPFYVCAPYSTFDPSTPDGGRIPIEERKPEEVRAFAGRPTAPAGTPVYNPAFDVTPAGLITALVTERGIMRRPDTAKIRRFLDAP